MLSDTQVEQVRSSLGHLHRFSVGEMEPDMLARLLRPPVTARWRDIGRVVPDVRTGEMLLRLQSLTKLDLRYGVSAACVDVLPQLPLLTSLRLRCDDDWFARAENLLASLQLCSCITDLSLECGFDSAHWSALFAKLTSIKKLTIHRGELKTLECFTSGPITESLQELTLDDLNLPPSELPHLYALRRLRALHLDNCFSLPLTDATVDSLTPPTSLLPALTKFGQVWCGSEDDDDAEDDDTERRGPSFEWMQQRLTQ